MKNTYIFYLSCIQAPLINLLTGKKRGSTLATAREGIAQIQKRVGHTIMLAKVNP